MFNFIPLLLNALGIGGDLLRNRAERKNLVAKQNHEIIKATTTAEVSRILSNTDADNNIDLITAKQKLKTLKDDVITYTFLMPVFIATATPFIIAWSNENWLNLAIDIESSYKNLDSLPDWYKYILALVVIDVLGFRSFTRKIVDSYFNKKIKKMNNIKDTNVHG